MGRSGDAGGTGSRAGIVVRDRPAAPLSGSLPAALAGMLGRTAGRAVVCARLSAPTPVAPEVLDAVVDALVDSGADHVTVGAGLGSRDRDRGHRSVSGLAHLAGLTGRTGRGRTYAVADLGEDLVAAPVDAAGVLAGRQVSRLWAGAATRVVLGRAVTDLMDGYAGCLDTLLGCCPEVPGAEPADVVVDLLRRLPPTLAVLDATVTSGGADGGRLLLPVATGTAVVATDAVLADGILAGLLGEDRGASRLVERSLARLGEPGGRIEGDREPFAGVSRPHPLARAAAREAGADRRLARVLSAATGGPDQGAAPADPVLATLRGVLTPAVAAASDPVGQAALVGILALAAAATGARQAWAVGLDKDAVERRVVPLGFDPGEYPAADYDGLPGFFAPFDAILDALPPPADGELRWCLVDGATVFEMSRDIAAGFDDFVARVDVAAGISLMADYLGGRRVEVAGPAEAGPAEAEPAEADAAEAGVARTRQAERNLYLPQPNYLAAWGGQPIDVCKIELVERSRDEHRLRWRTVRSPNGSATYDDGTLTFARAGAGTRATVRGRQLFTLPPRWAGVDLAALPEVRDPLLEDAYRRFFTATFDNLEACFEGRPFRIGRPAPEADEPLLTQTLQFVLEAAGQWLQSRTGATAATGPTGATGMAGAGGAAPAGSPAGSDAVPDEVDVLGFRHVRGRR